MPNRPCPAPPRRRGLAALGATVALLAAAPAAADAARWIDGPRFDVGAPSTGTQLGVAPDGTAMAIWFAGKIGAVPRPLLMFQRVAGDGTRGRATSLEAFPGDAVGVADLAVGTGGHGAVVWSPRVGNAPAAVQLTLIGTDGATRPAIEVATDARAADPSVAVDAAGNALVAWGALAQDGVSYVAKARRVTADGALGAVVEFGGGDLMVGVDTALAPDGAGWAAWSGLDVSGVARITATGGLDGSSETAAPMAFSTLSAASAGGAISGVALEGGDIVLAGARLPRTGDVIGPRLAGTVLEDAEIQTLSLRPALEPDGTVTLAWSDVDFTGPTPRGWATYARFGPGQTTAAPQRLPQVNGSTIEFMPVFTALPDGGALVSYLAATDPANMKMVVGKLAADGGLSLFEDSGIPVPATPSTNGGAPPTVQAEQAHQPFPLSGGSVLFATVDNAALQADVDTAAAIRTRIYDAAPPQLTATIPANGAPGSALVFSATATDAHSGATIAWEFGDGGGAAGATAAHAYANPGVYTVTASATDGAGNVARSSRQVTIAAPAGPPPPEPEARRAPARLKLTRVVRRGAKVTISGTIARGATGRVTLAYRQRDGRSTTTVGGRARIAKGRFSATIRVTRALLRRFRVKPTVAAAYAGNSAIAAGSATRTVTIARAARRTTRRGARRKR